MMNKTEVYHLAIELAKKYPSRWNKHSWMEDEKVKDLDWFDLLQIKTRIEVNKQLIYENRISEL